MPVVSREVMIDAPRSAVWATLADIGSVSAWNPVVEHSVETADAERADEVEAAGVGSARHCELPGSMGAIDEVVTAWDEHESMGFDVFGAKMMRAMHARFELSEVGAATRVLMTSDYTMSFGPLGSLMASTMGKRMMTGNMEKTLAGLKAHVEEWGATAAGAEAAASPSER